MEDHRSQQQTLVENGVQGMEGVNGEEITGGTGDLEEVDGVEEEVAEKGGVEEDGVADGVGGGIVEVEADVAKAGEAKVEDAGVDVGVDVAAVPQVQAEKEAEDEDVIGTVVRQVQREKEEVETDTVTVARAVVRQEERDGITMALRPNLVKEGRENQNRARVYRLRNETKRQLLDQQNSKSLAYPSQDENVKVGIMKDLIAATLHQTQTHRVTNDQSKRWVWDWAFRQRSDKRENNRIQEGNVATEVVTASTLATPRQGERKQVVHQVRTVMY